MFSFFANIFGYILNLLYNLVNNYGLAIILFTVLIKLAMLPLSIKQQKSLKKNTKIQKEMQIIQFKYKNDPEKMNQAVMKLYKDNNVSPFSGCLGSILQLILLLSVFYMVSSPLKYVEKIPTEVVDNMKTQISEAGSDNKNLAYPEIDIIRSAEILKKIEIVDNSETTEPLKFDENQENIEKTILNIIKEKNYTITAEDNKNMVAEVVNSYNQSVDKTKGLKQNMNFFGLDLSKIPQQNLSDYTVYIIPALYILSTFISMRLTVKMQENMKAAQSTDNDEVIINKDKEKEENAETPEEEDTMMQTNKMMSWMMPILSVSIAFVAPLGLALYWLVNNITMILERIVLDKLIKLED